MTFNIYSGNLGSAALVPEPINRLPERSGEARNLERDKASPQHPIKPVSPEQSAQASAKFQGLNKGLGNTKSKEENISATLFPKLCIT